MPRVAGADLSLADGPSTCPLTTNDLDDTVAMVNACGSTTWGRRCWRADLLSDAAAKGFDPDADRLGVFDERRIVTIVVRM